MKTLKFFGFICIIFMLFSCDKKAPATDELLQDEDRKEEIMSHISKNRELRKEMMRVIVHNNDTMPMLFDDKKMMKSMMKNHEQMMEHMSQDTLMAGMMMENMILMMEKDTDMCRVMSRKLMNNKHMKEMMLQYKDYIEKGGNTSVAWDCSMHL